MKMTRFLAQSLVLLPAVLAAPSFAFAQTCAAPLVVSNATLTPPALPTAGNTCAAPTGTGANTIGAYCGAAVSTETEIIYQVALGAGATGSFSLTGITAPFDPAIVLFQAADATACLLAAGCVGLPIDNGGPGANESLAFAGLPAGSYYISVVGTPGSNSCGAYTLTVVPTLPVQLQQFSVE